MSVDPLNDPLSAVFQVQAESHATYNLTMRISCPICHETQIIKNGHRPRLNGYIQQFECINPKCSAFHATYPRHGKQFTYTTSGEIHQLIRDEIQRAYDSLYHHSVRGTELARSTGLSEAWVSYLRKELDEIITRGIKRDEQTRAFNLVSSPTDDEAVSVDETFFKIKTLTVYVIIIRGYLSRKVLAINTSLSRKEEDMNLALQEAQGNCQKQIRIITADAWGATEVMVRHLNRPITLIMHRHKRPYDKAVIERSEYDPSQNLRTVTQVGVPTDIFLTEAKRAAFYLEFTEPIDPPKKETLPRGRPKGVKDKVPRTRKKTSIQEHLAKEEQNSLESEDATDQKKSAVEKVSFGSLPSEPDFM